MQRRSPGLPGVAGCLLPLAAGGVASRRWRPTRLLCICSSILIGARSDPLASSPDAPVAPRQPRGRGTTSSKPDSIRNAPPLHSLRNTYSGKEPSYMFQNLVLSMQAEERPWTRPSLHSFTRQAHHGVRRQSRSHPSWHNLLLQTLRNPRRLRWNVLWVPPLQSSLTSRFS